MKSKEQVSTIIAALKTLYPDALCSLDYEKDYELLFSVRLAIEYRFMPEAIHATTV